jgi:uncharacterized protein YbjQ (UPF0145 family)
LGVEKAVLTIRKILCRAAIAGALAALAAAPATAEDAIVALDLQKALTTPDAQKEMDPAIKLYFGKTAHPAITEHLGEAYANRRANGFGRNDTRGCERAFLNAVVNLQAKAKKLGANAVINVNSYFKKNEVAIDTTVECHSGFLMDGVALKGEFVKLAD